ncbi:MAG TPA: HAD-IB family hydrolase [Actinomycetales bacterium]|nr:HAD-IB family hydrolase [Actinomycetales bacterium]
MSSITDRADERKDRPGVRIVDVVTAHHRPGPRSSRRPRRVAAFFDLDKTIIATSSVFAFNKSFLDEGLLSRRSVIDLAYTQLAFSLSGADDDQMAKVRQAMAAATKGWEPARVERIVTEALTEIVRPTVFAEARDLLAEHRALGHDLVIVSASGEELVAPIARMLGADHYAGTRMARDADGRYAGEIEFYCQGRGKAEAVRVFAERYGYDLDSCYAYSDSSTDLPMLEEVGHPTAINPDRVLRREALERGWPILTFENPMPLLPSFEPATGPIVGVASLVLAVGAAACSFALAARRER